ncbi:MAG TPA: tetratricopeptide repeat protein [Terriglobia bacterium]|nr:tetratricopeptide repeat protein [Terriglobia bacterium]
MRKASDVRKSGAQKRGSRLVTSSAVRQKNGLSKDTQAGLKGRRAVFRLKKTSMTKHKIVTAKKRIAVRNKKGAPRETLLARQTSLRNPVLSAAKSAALRQYESAIKLMYSQDFEGARTIFIKIIGTNPDDKEIQERVKTHLRLCEQKMARRPSAPKTLEEHYDVGVALMNQGRYEEARDHYQKALKLNPQSDFVIYAIAALSCRTGDLDNALTSLKAAIQLRPDNRYLAQHDSDFEPLMQDARFISIIFPERLNPIAS